MNTKGKLLLPLLLTLLIAIRTTAQAPDPLSSSVAFSRYSINEGMSSNNVRALVQDDNGFVWAGTSRGVNRFDGHRIVTLKGTLGIAVTCMDAGKDTLWIGTSSGLYMYLLDKDRVKKIDLVDMGHRYDELNITDMKYDGKGQLWFTTMTDGIFRLQTKTEQLQHISTPDSTVMYGHIYINKLGQIWASSNWNKHNLVVYQYHNDTFVNYDLKFSEQGPGRIRTLALTQTKEGAMWAALWDGTVVSFDPSFHKARVEFTAEQTGMTNAHSILEVEPGMLFVGSDRGLAVLTIKDRKVKVYNREGYMASSLSDDFVYPILKDREGGTWIGTYYGGVNYTHPISTNFVSCVHSNYANSVSGNVINKFCEDRQSRLWISSDDGGLCYYDPETHLFNRVPLGPDGSSHNTHALCRDGEILYVGTYSQGMDIVDLKTMKVDNVPVFRDADGNALDRSSYAIYKDRKGTIWVGTFSGVTHYNAATRTFTPVKDVGVPVLDILQDCVDCMWLATDGNGLWRQNVKGEWKHYLDLDAGNETPETPVTVNTLFEDTDGDLWVGASNGFYRYDRMADKFDRIWLGEEHICVYGIAYVDSKLWLTTTNGVICYSLSMNSVLKVYKSGGNIANINFMPDAIYCTREGRVYAGTTEGFISFQPREMRSNPVKPTVIFTDLEVFNRPVPVGSDILPAPLPSLKQLDLSYRESVFRISFSAMSYLSPKDITYSYYLEGFEKEWAESDAHSVTYTNLSPGTYLLHVRATMNDGMQSDEAVLRIVIAPPFYWNPISQTIYCFLFLFLLFLAVRYLLRRNERRHVAQIEEITVQKEQAIQEVTVKKEQEIEEVTKQKEQEIEEVTKQKEQEIKEVTKQKELEIQEVTEQKEQEIKEINTRMEEELHAARIRFMTLTEKDQAFLDNLEKVIEKNFSNAEFAIDDLADSMGVSRSSLFNKVKALADVTPNELIQVIRLRHAASLLDSGNYRVSEVCYMVGFSSPSYFAKCFQRQYGVTPAKYKT